MQYNKPKDTLYDYAVVVFQAFLVCSASGALGWMANNYV